MFCLNEDKNILKFSNVCCRVGVVCELCTPNIFPKARSLDEIVSNSFPDGMKCKHCFTSIGSKVYCRFGRLRSIPTIAKPRVLLGSFPVQSTCFHDYSLRNRSHLKEAVYAATMYARCRVFLKSCSKYKETIKEIENKEGQPCVFPVSLFRVVRKKTCQLLKMLESNKEYFACLLDPREPEAIELFLSDSNHRVVEMREKFDRQSLRGVSLSLTVWYHELHDRAVDFVYRSTSSGLINAPPKADYIADRDLFYPFVFD